MRLRTFGGLWIEDAIAGAPPTPRPRPLGLLAILAVAGQKGVSRDRLLGVLWPDAEAERARHALSQTIYSLRKDLGVEVLLSTPDLRLDPAAISSDVSELQAAIKVKDWRTAAALYAGPFLEGFYLADAPEFERWVETERASLANDGMRAIEQLGKERTASGAHEEAAECYRRLTRLDPVNSRFAMSYMEALERVGDRTAALAHGKSYAKLVQRELEIPPDDDVLRLIARLRDSERARPAPRVEPAPPPAIVDRDATTDAPSMAAPNAPAPAPSHAPTPAIVEARARRTRMSRAVLTASLVVVSIGLVAFFARRSTGRPRSDLPVLAVGRIRDLGSPDSTAIGGVMREMLSTSLGRVAELQVISNSRMLELTARGGDTSSGAITDAARRAGATEIIEGELIPLADRKLRLELRRVDVDSGRVRGGFQLEGADRIALFDSAAALIADQFRVEGPTQSLADVSTRSPIAYRLYEEGLRDFYQFDAYSANRLFRAAVREDSSFAMAVYYAWRSAVAVNDTDQVRLAKLALALAPRASEHDGLLIRTHVGFARNDLASLSAAESLAARYPRDPEALIRAAEPTPDLRRAVALLNRSIALDSAAMLRTASVCRLCEALNDLSNRYVWADSLDAAEHVLQRWVALRPDDYVPLAALGDLYISMGRLADARDADRRAAALGNVAGDLATRNLVWSLRTDDLDAADAACAAGLAITDAAKFESFRWFCTIALRMQGRYRDALGLVQEGREPRTGVVHREAGADPYNEAVLDFEMGRPLVAADEFREIVNQPIDTSRVSAAKHARDLTWYMTLSATAAVAGNDTVRASALVDSIRTVGSHSLFPRDPLLYHFVRGILLARAQQHSAAAGELRAAISSPTNGYTRINYELGRSLLAAGRPADGIPIVSAALRGGIEGSGLYVTRTELHELLAQLYDAAGRRDSAAMQYRIVERAWRGADPFIAPRGQAARDWLARGGGRR